ncbi:DUF1854 domain-containing protein [Paucibacter sp. Y2R2-4]|uniref:cyanophycin metabolism-associated DUF1854 family protein n=1 Tax=Paucibacter sp. Y2R2-4 TaxID=2893553 RepID=UPI0021E4A108|nr:DUF1854 domain-containing protein [Paucibacter sp. Y2R2-4]MCV2350158.1 DUF1854 domain-containing protein [Paucibacter sp. Y2R2-4]
MSENKTMAIFQKLSRNAFGRLVLTDLQGQEHRDINVVRAHPISAPDEGISLLGSDGHELAWIDRLSDLPATDRELLTAELASREFVPMIQRIKEVSTFSTPSQWTVETDRGETRFILKTEEDIRRLGEGRLLISSSHGLQLMVQDRFALDRPSKKILERFL